LTEIDDLVIIAAEDIDPRRYQEADVPEIIDPVTQHHINQAADR